MSLFFFVPRFLVFCLCRRDRNVRRRIRKNPTLTRTTVRVGKCVTIPEISPTVFLGVFGVVTATFPKPITLVWVVGVLTLELTGTALARTEVSSVVKTAVFGVEAIIQTILPQSIPGVIGGRDTLSLHHWIEVDETLHAAATRTSSLAVAGYLGVENATALQPLLPLEPGTVLVGIASRTALRQARGGDIIERSNSTVLRVATTTFAFVVAAPANTVVNALALAVESDIGVAAEIIGSGVGIVVHIARVRVHATHLRILSQTPFIRVQTHTPIGVSFAQIEVGGAEKGRATIAVIPLTPLDVEEGIAHRITTSIPSLLLDALAVCFVHHGTQLYNRGVTLSPLLIESCRGPRLVAAISIIAAS